MKEDQQKPQRLSAELLTVIAQGASAETEMLLDHIAALESELTDENGRNEALKMAGRLAWEAVQKRCTFETIAEERRMYLQLHGSLPVPREIGPSGALYGWWIEFCPDQSFLICKIGQEEYLWAWQVNHFPTEDHRIELEDACKNHWATTMKHESSVLPGWNPPVRK